MQHPPCSPSPGQRSPVEWQGVEQPLPSGLARWQNFLGDDSGQDMIEYVLAAALIGLVALSAVRSLGTHISSAYNSIGSNLTSDS